IVAHTFPLIGNYGVNAEDNEAAKPAASGMVVREWCNTPSGFRSEGNINDFLKKNNVVGIHSIDTRSLTRTLRDEGTMNGVITTENVFEKKEEFLKKIADYKITNALENTSVKSAETFKAEKPLHNVVMVDYGYRNSIKNELLKRGCNVTVVPYNTSADEIIKLSPDGIVLSNGAGNPEEYSEQIDVIKKLAETKIPMFGIELGHQLLALSQGAKITKLKHGHRGASQPVIDLEKEQTYVTSQSHSFTVDGLSETVGKTIMKNDNDNSCEGIRYTKINAFSVEFDPVAHGGPYEFIFDDFVKMFAK
ncbi:MAG: carbamoyl phosphate synthase small subunit, partial [Oscillospiraceae bacterium]